MKNKILMLAAILMLTIFSTSLIFATPNVKFNKIAGVVKNANKQPFPFVYVYLKDYPQIKTATELDGTFSLIVPDTIKFPLTVEFHTVGAKTKTHTVTARKKSRKITIILEIEKPKEIPTVEPNESEKETHRFLAGGVARTSFDGDFTVTVTDFAIAASERGGDATGFAKNDFATVEFADKMSASVMPPREQPDAAAGLLTAGELNDFTKWTLWQDIAKNQLEAHQKEWKILPDERYVAQLTNPYGMAIVDAKVYLKDVRGNTLWQARTDNTGKAELWAKMLDDGLQNFGEPYFLVYSYQGKTIETPAFPFNQRINMAELKVNCSEAKQVDIHFIVDATGSMGDEIKYLQAELYDVIENFKQKNSHLRLRTGSVFYRDVGDEYLTRKLPLDADINKTIEFIKEQSANGGGDYPEAVDAALIEAIENENWSENALSRIAFLVLDAPPHSDETSIARMHRQIRLAAMKGIRIVPLVCSGADKSTEYLMRSIALATNGTYVFLTDESGIGGPHMKPTTDKYEVEKLNHILLRIISEYSTIPNCNNDWANFDQEISSQEKFIPKPYKENPEGETERLETSQVMNIYPNPCNGNLNVDILLPVFELYITDGTGKALQYFSFDSPRNFTVDLNGYSNGVYFINAFYQGRWYSLKFLLVR